MSDNKNEEDFKWVEACTLQGTVFAEMAKEALDNNNIPCVINNISFMSSAYSIHSTNTAGINARVMVPEDKLEVSKEIISKILDVEM